MRVPSFKFYNQRNRSRSPNRRYDYGLSSYSENMSSNGYGRYGKARERGRRTSIRTGSRYDSSGSFSGYNKGISLGRSKRRGRGRELGPRVPESFDMDYDDRPKNYNNSIFIGNLSFDTTPQDLQSFFAEVGNVKRAEIVTKKGRHRGLGTVEFTDPDAVEQAIANFDGAIFFDREIYVKRDNPPDEKTLISNPLQERLLPIEQEPMMIQSSYEEQNRPRGYELFIVNLPYAITWQVLKDMFRECGHVVRADVEVDRRGYSRGFGTVLMSTPEEMWRGIEMFNGYNLEGRVLEVREGRFNSGIGIKESVVVEEPIHEPVEHSNFTVGVVGGGERNSLIYCSNMPLSTAESDLYDLFETFGKILRAELKYDSTGMPTGIAVVEYKYMEDADVCVQQLHNYNYGGCDLDISYASRQA